MEPLERGVSGFLLTWRVWTSPSRVEGSTNSSHSISCPITAGFGSFTLPVRVLVLKAAAFQLHAAGVKQNNISLVTFGKIVQTAL